MQAIFLHSHLLLHYFVFPAQNVHNTLGVTDNRVGYIQEQEGRTSFRFSGIYVMCLDV